MTRAGVLSFADSQSISRRQRLASERCSCKSLAKHQICSFVAFSLFLYLPLSVSLWPQVGKPQHKLNLYAATAEATARRHMCMLRFKTVFNTGYSRVLWQDTLSTWANTKNVWQPRRYISSQILNRSVTGTKRANFSSRKLFRLRFAKVEKTQLKSKNRDLSLK